MKKKLIDRRLCKTLIFNVLPPPYSPKNAGAHGGVCICILIHRY